MYSKFQEHLRKELQGIREAGLYKEERVIVTPQGSDIEVANQNGDVLNFCANNYLGLADNSRASPPRTASGSRWCYASAYTP